MSGRLVLGLDIGSTGVKILAADDQGRELLVRQRPTPWRSGAGGTTEIDAPDLLATLTSLFAQVAEELEALQGRGARVAAIAISGMGETGFLVDGGGQAVVPGFAWFDPRGRAQIDALPPQLTGEFSTRTGLPVGAQVSVAKISVLVQRGVDLTGLRWMNVPEFVAQALGAATVSEYSLASRTGLLDQDTGEAWPQMLKHLGVTSDFIPPLVHAGTDLGSASASWLPLTFHGARVTVAGHDHLVSLVSAGGGSEDGLHVSMGTAEVVLRVRDEPIPADSRRRLADVLINSVRHVIPGRYVLVAGVKTGLLMRRALQLSGVTDRAGRDALDELALALPVEGLLAADSVEVRGARNDDGVLSLTVRADGVGPAELFNALLRHGNDEIAELLAAMDREVPAAHTTVLSGGWAGMKSVRRARSEVLPGVRTSGRDQDTAYGAVLFALRLLPDLAAARPTREQPSPGTLDYPRKQEHSMNELTTLERRGMAAISTASGQMLIVAADQRNGMKAVMNDAPDGPSSVTAEQLASAKSDLVRYLGNHAPAILLDAEVALPGVVDDATLSRDTGLVVGMDASGFDTVDGLRYTRYVEGVTPRKVRQLGGDAAKMLFYMRPDRQDADSAVATQIRELVQACNEEGLLLIVEILTYRLEDETEEMYREVFPSLVAEAAAISVECGAKVLKLPYPGSAEASAAVTSAAAGVPWAVLSAGVDHETFIGQVEIAVANGARGAMAGRSLWKDSLAVSAQVREDLLTSRALGRLHELAATVDGATVRV